MIASLTSMQKMTVLLILARPVYTKVNKNKLNTDGGSGIGGGKIDNRIVNLLSFIKKISFGMGFFTPKASLIFT